MTTAFKIDFEGQIKEQMEVHWDMSPEHYDTFRVGARNELNPGWAEVEFIDGEGNPAFYIEVNRDGQVWHFDWI